MRTTSLQLVFLFAFSAPLVMAQGSKHEVGLTLGSIKSQTRTLTNQPTPPVPGFVGSQFKLGSGNAWQANYAYRIAGARAAALYVGAHLAASPQRKITEAPPNLTRDVASLYITPDVMFKLLPNARISPWATVGAGYALYEQSTTTIDGSPNPAPRHTNKGVVMYGGGVDVRILPFLAIRGEVRDFYTGNPSYNIQPKDSQHNLVSGGGVVLRF